jgi:DNA repair protein RadD
MIWKYLGQQGLQGEIDPSLLNRLEPVLQTLDARGAINLYGKETLARIFDAFIGLSRMSDCNFRRSVLNCMPQDALLALGGAMGVATAGESFADIREGIMELDWKRQETLNLFAAHGGLSNAAVPPAGKASPKQFQLPAAPRPHFPLQDYQFTIYRQAVERLAIPRSRFLIQMPTGSGKTRTAMEFVAQHLNEAGQSPNTQASVVWLAHNEELCSQALECFVHTWTHLGRHNVQCHRMWGRGGTLPVEGGLCLTVGSFQRLYSEVASKSVVTQAAARKITLVIVDEAHRVMAPTYREVTDSLLSGGGKLVGLTATPGRSAENCIANRELSEYFHGEIVRLHFEDGRSPIQVLRDRGVLSRLTCQPLVSPVNFALTDVERHYVSRNFDLPPAALRRIGDDDVRNVEIIRRLRDEADGGSRVIFFACSVEHSKYICALLCYFGIAAAHVDGNTDIARRGAVIDGFRRGSLQVICNFGILTTGFDAPKTDVVFIARPTSSVVLYSQMIGRGLRGPRLGGTEFCKLIDVRDNIDGFVGQVDLYEYFDEYWN